MSYFQHLYQENQALKDANPDADQIREAREAGKWVVVVEKAYYCPSTDALMGSTYHFGSAHATVADARAQTKRDTKLAGDEISFIVKPPVKPLKKKMVILQKGDKHQVAFNSGSGELWVRGSEEPVGSKGRKMGVEEGRAYYRELVSQGYKRVLNW